MSKPGTITEWLQGQHPNLLPEVITDLQVLKGEKLRERISQWMVYLAEVLGEGGVAEDKVALALMQSPRKQCAFLEEHLAVYDIIAVLTSIDPNSPLLEKYYRLQSEISIEDPYLGETLIAGIYNDYMTCNSHLSLLCTELTNALALLLKKKNQNGDVGTTLCRQIARGSSLFADIVMHTKQALRYKKAIGLYARAQDLINTSNCMTKREEIDIIMSSARVYRNAGQLIEAFASYTKSIAQCIDWLDTLENESASGSSDPIYAPWRNFMLQQHHDCATTMFLMSGLFMLQVKLEEIEGGLIANEEDIIPALYRDLDETYTVIKNKGWIEPNISSPYEVANVWRFTYGWFMMIVNEPSYARKELLLIDNNTTPKILHTATKYLLEGYSVSFIQTQKMEPKPCKIVSFSAAR